MRKESSRHKVIWIGFRASTEECLDTNPLFGFSFKVSLALLPLRPTPVEHKPIEKKNRTGESLPPRLISTLVIFFFFFLKRNTLLSRRRYSLSVKIGDVCK